MNFILTLIILIVILGVIVFVHEFGHFIAAKKSGVYVSEFSIGMGPKLFSFRRKNDETLYSLRLLPLGGYNMLANTEEENPKLKKDRILENKTFLQKILVLIMGIIFNVILAIVLLFINGLIYGSPETKPYVGNVLEDSPADKSGVESGDLILKVNDKKVSSWDEVLLETHYKELTETYYFELKSSDGKIKKIDIAPLVSKNEENEEVRTFGFSSANIKRTGFVNALKYAFTGTYSMIDSLFVILGNLFTGKIGADNLSGPIGVFTVVDTVKESGLESLIYLTAYLSLNVGIINLLPIPVFDGGRILLVIIEKIKGKKVNPKLESYLNTAGAILLIILMIFVTLNDILKLF